MWQIIIAIITAIIGLLVTVVVVNWDEIREEVTNWLHERNLNESNLMNVWVEIALVMDSAVRRVKIRTKSSVEQIVSEKTFRRDEINEPDIISELERRGYYRKDITEMFV